MKGVKEVKSGPARLTMSFVIGMTLLFGARSLFGHAGLLFPIPASTQSAPNTLTSAERSAGWKLLFDGKKIDRWRGFKEKTVPAGWQVVEGAITRVSEGADLVSRDEFSSFDFRFDWMIASGGNSGVMFHVTEAGAATYETGPEYQILDNARHEDGKSPLTTAAACYGLYAPPKDFTRAVGSWNEGRIVVAGSKVEHWLNGERTASYELGSAEWNAKVAASKFNEWKGFGKASRGRLALQQHDARVAYRNLKIKALTSK